MSGISDYDRRALAEILDGHGDWFSARLLRLCAAADFENLARLRLGFPEHVAAYVAWRDSPTMTTATAVVSEKDRLRDTRNGGES